MSTSSIQDLLRPFREAQEEIARAMEPGSYLRQALTASGRLTVEDVTGFVVELAENLTGGLYDHLEQQRIFRLDQRLVSAFHAYWTAHSIRPELRRIMAKLFFVHELIHVDQGVSSSTYDQGHAGSRSTTEAFTRFDYRADAESIKACYLSVASGERLDKETLKEILSAVVHGGNVFRFVEDPAHAASSIEGSRLARQLVWLFLHACAAAFASDRSFADFPLGRELRFQVFPLTGAGYAADLCESAAVSAEQLRPPLEIKISIGDIGSASLTVALLSDAEALRLAALGGQVDAAFELFRAFLLTEGQIFVGRHAGGTRSAQGDRIADSGVKSPIPIVAALGDAVDARVFKGRERELDAIGAWLEQGTPRGWLVHGMPGQGKSELVRRFAFRHWHRYERVVEASLHASNADQAIDGIASTLVGDESPSLSVDQQVAEIIAFAQVHTILLIVDGLERELEEGLLPPSGLRDLMLGLLGPQSRAHVVITSTNDVHGLDQFGVLRAAPLSPLDPGEGCELLRALGATESNETLERISSALRGHPLSLTAAVPILRRLGADEITRLARGISDDKRVRRLIFRFREALSAQGSMLINILAACAGPVSPPLLSLVLADRHVAPLTDESLDAAIIECGGMVWMTHDRRLDIHPVVRELFQANWIREHRVRAKAVHEIFARSFEARASAELEAGRGLAGLEPALAAIHHRLLRGEVEIASKIKHRFLDQSNSLTLILGAWGLVRDHSLKFFHDDDTRRPRKGLHPINVGALLHNIGYAEMRLGRLAKALLSLEAGSRALRGVILQMKAPNGAKDLDMFAQSWLGLSMCRAGAVECLGMLGRFEEAEKEAKADLAMWSSTSVLARIGVRADPALTDCLPQLGAVKTWRGDFIGALADFERATQYLATHEPPRRVLERDFARRHVEALLLVDRYGNLARASEIHALSTAEAQEWREERLELAIQSAMLARLRGETDQCLGLLEAVERDARAAETVQVRIRQDLEYARCYLQLDRHVDAVRYADRAFQLARRKSHLILWIDALCLLAEADSAKAQENNWLNEVADAVRGMGYGRRLRDLECLESKRRPVIEIGL